MRTSDLSFTTERSVRELGETFRGEAHRMHTPMTKLFNRFRSYGKSFEFFTPGRDQFSQLDNELPAFSVGVNIPTFSGWNGGSVTLVMAVFERGAHREVRLATAHGMVSGARRSKRYLTRMASALDAHAVAGASALTA